MPLALDQGGGSAENSITMGNFVKSLHLNWAILRKIQVLLFLFILFWFRWLDLFKVQGLKKITSSLPIISEIFVRLQSLTAGKSEPESSTKSLNDLSKLSPRSSEDRVGVGAEGKVPQPVRRTSSSEEKCYDLRDTRKGNAGSSIAQRRRGPKGLAKDFFQDASTRTGISGGRVGEREKEVERLRENPEAPSASDRSGLWRSDSPPPDTRPGEPTGENSDPELSSPQRSIRLRQRLAVEIAAEEAARQKELEKDAEKERRRQRELSKSRLMEKGEEAYGFVEEAVQGMEGREGEASGSVSLGQEPRQTFWKRSWSSFGNIGQFVDPGGDDEEYEQEVLSRYSTEDLLPYLDVHQGMYHFSPPLGSATPPYASPVEDD